MPVLFDQQSELRGILITIKDKREVILAFQILAQGL